MMFLTLKHHRMTYVTSTEDQYFLLSGECSPWPSKDRLATLLETAGLTPSAGLHSIRVKECEHFVFQHLAGVVAPTIEASAATEDQLVSDASLISSALAQAGVKHRFELYGPDERLAHYLHHDWPQTK